MKQLIFGLPFLTACYSLPFTSSCDKTADSDRVRRAVSYMEQHYNVMTVEVRYDRRRNMAIVAGYDINRRFVRSERVPQSCKL